MHLSNGYPSVRMLDYGGPLPPPMSTELPEARYSAVMRRKTEPSPLVEPPYDTTARQESIYEEPFEVVRTAPRLFSIFACKGTRTYAQITVQKSPKRNERFRASLQHQTTGDWWRECVIIRRIIHLIAVSGGDSVLTGASEVSSDNPRVRNSVVEPSSSSQVHR